ATQIAEGELELEAPVEGPTEVIRLAGAFNSMTAQLHDLIGSLEQRVADRTQRLEVLATLSERLSAILDFDQLLMELVNQVKERFDYYHAHVYILDDNRQNLVMTAGAGRAGAEMKARGHNIALNAPTSLVARAARSGEIVWVDNVREAEDWLPNPLLPDTYSEMAVPIILEDQIMGVLDVQEDEVAGLDESDASLLRSLANQVAVAIRNARLFARVETALTETRTAHERYLAQSWQKARMITQSGQYHYTRPQVADLPEEMLTQARQQALGQDRPAIIPLKPEHISENQDRSPTTLVAPVTLRNKTIGALQLHPTRDDQQWTEDDLAIVEAVVDQLAQSAESLRLFGETRQRVGLEQTTREITDKLRQAPTLEILARTASEELSKVLGVSHSLVRIGVEARPLAGYETTLSGNEIVK
ncbi:MAG: GAF domain-containing protein, partial [Anaerolineae bacterium]|nr:GAF domain-containing protein [Anaerolineae bacterium]